MSNERPSAAPRLVGRDAEARRLSALLEVAAAGEAQTVLLTGPAGVGKTWLWQSVAAASGVTTAVGRCLPMAAVSVPFAAVRRAVSSLAATGTGAEGAVTDGSEGTVPARFDRWLDEQSARAPLLLVVEDLHWADPLSLDALLYVIGGPERRRLAVIGTVRSEEAGNGLPIERWLGDARRLPRVSEVDVAPLDRMATGELLGDLLGGTPHQALLDDVFRRSGGVPLFARLLAEGASARDERARLHASVSLREAVLQSWYRLPGEVRDVLAQLAVGSGPMTADELAAVVGGRPARLARRLAEGVGAGVLHREQNGAFWFSHPLHAEVLEEAVPAETRAGWHLSFARALEVADPGSPRTSTAVAEHRFRAGDLPGSYSWSLRSASAHLAAGTPSEAVRQLRRAVDLRAVVGAAETEVDLLRRLREAAARAGSFRDELEAVESLVALTSAEDEPLVLSELLVRRAHLRLTTGRGFLEPEVLAEALRRAAPYPDSPEFALSLAELAHAELWHGRPEGPDRARAALTAAVAARDDRALAYALAANSLAALARGDTEAGHVWGTEAVSAAFASGDWWACVHAIFWETNAIDYPWSRTVPEALRVRRTQLADAGAPHSYGALLAGAEALSWVALGEWEQGAERLRDVLVADPGPLAEANASLLAARLAALQGRVREAGQHLAHADDLLEGATRFLNLEFDAVCAEVRLLTGDVDASLRTVEAALTDGRPRTMCEWLVPLGARALADQVRAERDARHDVRDVLARVDDFEARHPAVVRDLGGMTPAYGRVLAGLEALLAAELARARRLPEEGERWVHAVERLRGAELAWEEAYACRRAAEALFDGRGAGKGLARDMLRRGLDLAGRLRAEPVLHELRALATRARVPTGTVPTASTTPGGQAGVTRREAEILALLAAGRTYGEIARTLVISEKTVSSHVSNLLAKTGTENRIALAAFAERTGLISGDAVRR